jgi:hypothetical protein
MTLYFFREGVIADGYDGAGFVLGVRDFDIARFAPQPPGFPLFIAAGKLFAALGVRPALGLAATSALFLAAGLAALAGLLRALAGRLGGVFFLLLGPTAPLVYGLGVSTLSDAAGLGCLLLALVWLLAALYTDRAPSALLRDHAVVGGLAGVALGMRPQLLPLLLLCLMSIYGLALSDPRRREDVRGRVTPRAVVVLAAALFATVLAWLVPLFLIVSPLRFLHLSLSHARGHLSDYGGGALVEATLLTGLLPRLRSLFAGLYEGALGARGYLLVPALFLAWALSCRRLSVGRSLRAVLVAGLAGAVYTAATLFTLPVGGHGRHLLPLAILGLALVSLLLARQAESLNRPLRALLLVPLLAMAVGNLRAVWAFRQSPPPGAALAAWLHAHGAPGPLYGARAARYLDLYRGSGSARPAVYFGEVLGDLAREDRLPAEVYLTSEVAASPASRPLLRTIERFCYPDAVPRVLRFDLAPGHGPSQTAFSGDCVELVAYRVRP